MDWYCIVRGFIGKITSLPFRKGRFPGIAFSSIFQLSSAEYQYTAHLQSCLHFGNHLLDHLMLTDWFGACFSFVAIIDTCFLAGLNLSDGTSSHSETTVV